ncbi:MAG TPA: hypothetical protein VJJ22_04825 [Candidatus Paceibacterota bacterium]
MENQEEMQTMTVEESLEQDFQNASREQLTAIARKAFRSGHEDVLAMIKEEFGKRQSGNTISKAA